MKTHLTNIKIMSALTHGDKGIFNVSQLTIALNRIKDFEVEKKVVHEAVRAAGASGELMYNIGYLLGMAGYYPRGYTLKFKPFKRKKFTDPNLEKKTSKYRGVSWNSRHECWQAQICINSKNKHVCNDLCEHEAARRWNVEAAKIGRRLNVIEEGLE
jgi:hypothetical protein